MLQIQELKRLSKQCVEAIKQIGEIFDARRQPLRKGGRRSGLEKVLCWRCKERGHYQRDCKQEESRQNLVLPSFFLTRTIEAAQS